MSERRCCCGKVMIPDDLAGCIFNDYGHEPLGPPGNFCGPRLHHELRDLKREIALAHAAGFREGVEASAKIALLWIEGGDVVRLSMAIKERLLPAPAKDGEGR